jgi:hypothetical protein
MNSSVWTIWVAQGSKEKNQFDFFLATFEGGFLNISWACSIHAKKLLNIKVRKILKNLQNLNQNLKYAITNLSVKERVAL